MLFLLLKGVTYRLPPVTTLGIYMDICCKKLTYTQPATNFSMLNPTFTGIDIYSATCYNIRHIYGHLLWGMTYKWPVYPNQQHSCCYLLGWQIDCHLLQNQTFTWPFVKKVDIYTANNHILHAWFTFNKEWHIECHLLQNYTYIWTYILKTDTYTASNKLLHSESNFHRDGHI